MTEFNVDKVMTRALRRLRHDWEKTELETTDHEGRIEESECWAIIAEGQAVIVDFDPDSMEFEVATLPIEFDYEEAGIDGALGMLGVAEAVMECLRGVHCVEINTVYLGAESAQCSLSYGFRWYSEAALRRDLEVGVEALLQAVSRLGECCNRSFEAFADLESSSP